MDRTFCDYRCGTALDGLEDVIVAVLDRPSNGDVDFAFPEPDYRK